MSTVFVISLLVLWALFLLQSAVILVLLRQVGVLHLRIAPAGARVLATGPPIGQAAPPVTLEDMEIDSERLDVSKSMDKDVLLLFVSPSCAVCASLVPALKPLMQELNGDVGWGIVTYGAWRECQQFRQRYKLDHLLVAYAPEVRDEYKVSVSPYAILISKEGIVLSKGLVNHIEHLESLFSARQSDADTRENSLVLDAAQPSAWSTKEPQP